MIEVILSERLQAPADIFDHLLTASYYLRL